MSLRTLKLVGLLAAMAIIPIVVAAPGQSANPGGVTCNTAGGKINGRGATFQVSAQQNAFIPDYRDVVCGPGIGTTMQQYQYPAATADPANFTGSTNGLRGLKCRTDPYIGTDAPYTKARLDVINGPNDGVMGALGGACPAATFTPPFAPGPPWPAPGAGNVKAISIPVALGAVALGYRFGSSACLPDPVPATISLTKDMVSGLLGGDIPNWSDARLRTGGLNPGLANCNVNVTRVHRFDGSGTTNTVKNYLINQGPGRIAGATCQAANAWNTFTPLDGNSWPHGTAGASGPDFADFNADSGCSALNLRSGTPNVLTRCNAVNGALCYGDIADVAAISAIRQIQVRNADDTAFAAPLRKNPNTGASTLSNCDATKTNTLPQPDPALPNPPDEAADAAVGLFPAFDGWSNDNATVNPGKPNHNDATFKGNKYPMCAMTFMMFYSGLSSTAVGTSAIDALSLDQRQNLYSFATHVLSVSAQERLKTQFYAPIPIAWQSTLTFGVQDNF